MSVEAVFRKALNQVLLLSSEKEIRSISYILVDIGVYTDIKMEDIQAIYDREYKKMEIFNTCELKMQYVYPEAYCKKCHTVYTLHTLDETCPSCCSSNRHIIRGDGIVVREVGLKKGS